MSYIESHDRAIEFLGCNFHGCPIHTITDCVGQNGKLNRINFKETMDHLKYLQICEIKLSMYGNALLENKLTKNM